MQTTAKNQHDNNNKKQATTTIAKKGILRKIPLTAKI